MSTAKLCKVTIYMLVITYSMVYGKALTSNLNFSSCLAIRVLRVQRSGASVLKALSQVCKSDATGPVWGPSSVPYRDQGGLITQGDSENTNVQKRAWDFVDCPGCTQTSSPFH